MKYLLAIDPGQVSGWAVLTIEASPKLISTGKVDFTRPLPWDEGDPRIVKSASDVFVRIRVCTQGDTMAIEDQYLDRGAKENVDTLKKLARNAGRWAEAAAHRGMRVRWIPPITWITKELGKGLRRQQIEILARQKVDTLYGADNRSEHENAAVLIGRYAATEIFWSGKHES